MASVLSAASSVVLSSSAGEMLWERRTGGIGILWDVLPESAKTHERNARVARQTDAKAIQRRPCASVWALLRLQDARISATAAAEIADPESRSTNPAKIQATRPAKSLAVTPLKSNETPLQEPSDVSIHSKHPNINSFSSIRAQGRKNEGADAQQESRNKNSAGGASKPSSTLRKVEEDSPLQAVLREMRGGAAADATDQGDPFDTFVKTWPKPDADEAMLKAAWHKRVVKPGIDPKIVIASARAWKRYYSLYSENYVPPAGKWLAEEGWRRAAPALSVDDRALADYFAILNKFEPKKRNATE